MTPADDDAELVAWRGARLQALLSSTDEPARAFAFPAERVARAVRHRVLVRRLGMAAGLALLLAGAAVPPVRAWIVNTARALWTSVRPNHAPAPATAPPAPGPGVIGAVSIPVSEAFTVRLAHRQTGGTLVIELTGDSVASVSVRADGDAGELVVLPEALRIVNEPASSASYLVRVPSRVSRLTVQAGGGAPRVLRPGAGTHWTIDLSGRGN